MGADVVGTVSIDQIRALRERDLNQLSLLLALLRNCSVSESARQLGMAQPSVSRLLDKMRVEFDDRLLVRRGNEMVRTTRGEALLPQLENLFSELNAHVFAKEPASPETSIRTLTIACNDYLQSSLAPALQRHLAIAAPHVKLRFTAPGHTRYNAVLDSGHADFVIGAECSAGELRTQHLFDEHFVAVVDQKNTEVTDKLTFAQFCGLKHIDHSPTGTYAIPRLLDRRTSELGGRRDTEIVATSAPAILEMIEGTPMVSIWYSTVANVMTRLGQCRAVRIVDLDFDFIRSRIVLCWGNQSHDDPFMTWAREQIGSIVSSAWTGSSPRAERPVAA